MKVWPDDVHDAVAALRQEFGSAELRSSDGGCWEIYVPAGEKGWFSIGDISGSLGECDHKGWGVELISPDLEYVGAVCCIPDRDIGELVDALRAYLERSI